MLRLYITVVVSVIHCYAMNFPVAHDTFGEFNQKCIFLPTYRELKENIKLWNEQGNINPSVLEKNSIISMEQFSDICDQYCKVIKESLFVHDSSWMLCNLKTKNAFFNYWTYRLNNEHESKLLAFFPYVQKAICDQEDIVFFKGDMHGDIHSLMVFLRFLQEKKYADSTDGFNLHPRVKLIFLGDYVDRGIYGVEVLYTVLRLKIENPDQVFLVRGNHEDLSLCEVYGFGHEFISKFWKDENASMVGRLFSRIGLIYETMPVALYLGLYDDYGMCNYLQCCHGGMEIGFNPQYLLQENDDILYQHIEALYGKSEYVAIGEQNPDIKKSRSFCKFADLNREDAILQDPGNCGFMWNDFTTDLFELPCKSPRGETLVIDKKMTEVILSQAKGLHHRLCGVVRAHQHSVDPLDSLMKQLFNSHGVARHWNEKNNKKHFHPWMGMVCTLLLSPDSLVGYQQKFDEDTILKLTFPHTTYEKWHFSITCIDVYSKLENYIENL